MKKIIAVIFLLLTIAPCAFAEYDIDPALAEVYPTILIIRQIDTETDTVTAVDLKGHVYTFSHCHDWYNGDVCAATMLDPGTYNDPTDDIVLTLLYYAASDEIKF